MRNVALKFQPVPQGLARQGQQDSYVYAGTHNCNAKTVKIHCAHAHAQAQAQALKVTRRLRSIRLIQSFNRVASRFHPSSFNQVASIQYSRG